VTPGRAPEAGEPNVQVISERALKGSAIVLRRKTPDLVRQEFYALVIAHYAIRKLMQ
jgi:hypothetical protein